MRSSGSATMKRTFRVASLVSGSMQNEGKHHRSKRHHKSGCQADEDHQEGVQVRHGRSPRRVRAHSEQNREPSPWFLDRRHFCEPCKKPAHELSCCPLSHYYCDYYCDCDLAAQVATAVTICAER